jgi:valyl-tRNA synthetase
LINKHIKDFRFDEASRVLYNFVWRSYCDWYLEFLKPIFNSKNKSSIQEAKYFSSYILLNTLKLLHPFIPFFTEHVWQINKFNNQQKTDLISSDWPVSKTIQLHKRNSEEIESIINIITSIRSTKVQLNVPAKEYCDIVYFNESKKIKKFINNNVEIIKQVGRVNNIISKNEKSDKIIEIIILKEKIGLMFETNVDLNAQMSILEEKMTIFADPDFQDNISNQISSAVATGQEQLSSAIETVTPQLEAGLEELNKVDLSGITIPTINY